MRNSQKKVSLNPKILIIYNAALNELSQNKNNEILSNYSEISSILQLDCNDLLKFIYLNRHNINEILYNEEKYIKIEIKEENKNLAYYFQLDLLINDNQIAVNYIYPIKIIEDISNYQKSIDKNLFYKKIIIAKIIIDLIDNIKNYEGYDNKFDEKLINFESESEDIINTNINNRKELKEIWDFNYLKRANIDVIYIDIIKSLFKKNNFESIENILQILNQIELESIYLTEKMIKEFSIIFNINNDFIKNYMINDVNDLININKIKFYVIIFKYIFKESIFIYQIPLLLKTRKMLINLIKNKLDELSFINIDDDIKKEIEYVLARITDSNFYYNKYVNYYIFPKLKHILQYYKNYLSESKSEDIIIIEKEINKRRINKANKYLIDYEISIKMNERFSIINFLFEQKENNALVTEKSLNKYANEWKVIEKKIKEQKFEDICEEDIRIIIDFLNNSEKEKIFINIFTKQIYKLFKKSLESKNWKDLNNAKTTKEYSKDLENNEYEEKRGQNWNNNSSLVPQNNPKDDEEVYNSQIKENIHKERKENIDKENDNSINHQKEEKETIEKESDDSINHQNDSIISDSDFHSNEGGDDMSQDNSIKQSEIKSKESSIIPSNIRYKIESDDPKKSSEKKDNSPKDYLLLKFIKIIGKHENTSEIVKEINEQKIISCGLFDINIYQSNYEFSKIQDHKNLDFINNIEELEYMPNIKLNILVSTKEYFNSLYLRTKKKNQFLRIKLSIFASKQTILLFLFAKKSK